jgi:A/G-specific adenine glycosylase
MCNELLIWFAENKRPLPWRQNPTPYAVLVSEIMAQQTRMAQLLPFYMRFMARFPTADALAKSELDEVLAVWAGMGYYARARNLHSAVKIIRAKYNDGWPTTRAEWEALPGIGAYTAGAVLAIAFGQREAAIDGNVLRLYARLENDATDIACAAAKMRATQLVHAHMPNKPGEICAYTQALMELGSLVCVPTHPKCEKCPLVYICKAYMAGCEKELPVKTKKKPSPVVDMTVLIIFSPRGRVLMRRRTEGLLKGMWVYCLTENPLADIHGYVKAMGYSVKTVYPLGEARHAFTHRVWQMTAYAVHVNEDCAVGDYRFLSPDEVDKAALPAAMRYFKPSM